MSGSSPADEGSRGRPSGRGPAERARPLRRRASRWLPVLGWMALIFVLSSQPGLRVSDDASVDSPVRAIAHLVVFGVLGALLFRATLPSLGSTGRAALAAFTIATLYGVTDELHQAFVPDRTGQLDDVVLDAIGAALGVAAAALALGALSSQASGAVGAGHGAGPVDERRRGER